MNNEDPWNIMGYFRTFVASLKKSFAATKGGEASFKLMSDGSYFNANATIAESFKMMEDAIESSGANSEGQRKAFTIGINCDADQCFNKDPKDPNKYE